MLKQNEKSQMIYVNVPFCNDDCYYCNFEHESDLNWQNKYFEAVKKEISSRKNIKTVSSIFFGGGTPSCVSPSFISEILSYIHANFILEPLCEISIEVDAQHLNEEKLKSYKNAGVNRLSFRVQTFEQKKLEVLGIRQSKQQVLKFVKLGKMLGFSLSTDLMIGLENQTGQELIADAQTLIEAGVEHFSVYSIVAEPGTKLEQMVENKQVNFLTENQSIQVYDQVFSFLKMQGFERYEVSNFAKNNSLSKHNLGYWQMKEYLGFGSGAHSLCGFERSFNSSNILTYIENKDVFKEQLTEEEFKEQAVMLGLRTKFGACKNIIKNQEALQLLLKEKIVKIEGNNVVVTENNFGALSSIILKLID